MTTGAQKLQLLMIEADKLTRLAIRLYLAGLKNIQVTEVPRLDEAMQALNESEFDCILVDLRLPDGDAFDFLRAVYEQSLIPPPIIVLTGVRKEELGLQLVGAGAQDFLIRSEISSLTLIRSIRYSMERARFQMEQYEANAKLMALATEDPLTDFLNREGFEKVLSDEVAEAENTGLWPICLMVNIENLKEINDTYGHTAGDQVLVNVAAALRRSTKKAEYWAKIGGVFLTLMHELTIDQAAGIGRLIENMLAKMPLYVEEDTVQLDVNVGVTIVPPDVQSINDIIDAIRLQPLDGEPPDAAETVFPGSEAEEPFDHGLVVPPAPAMQALAASGSEVPLDKIGRLRMILESSDQLSVVRQSVFDLTNGRVVSYELMIRGPEGMENPADLFDVDGDQELLRAMDLKCLETCLLSARQVPKRLRLHVNVFPTTLIQTPAEELIELFRRHGAVQRVFLDINTQWIVGQPAQLSEPVDRLRKAGIMISLDHVEVGRSFMQALLLLKPRVIKTDSELVSDLANDYAKRRNLQRLLSIAISIGSKLVAVGLENEPDVKAARDMGIRFGQGYFLGELAFVEEGA